MPSPPESWPKTIMVCCECGGLVEGQAGEWCKDPEGHADHPCKSVQVIPAEADPERLTVEEKQRLLRANHTEECPVTLIAGSVQIGHDEDCTCGYASALAKLRASLEREDG